MNHTGTIHFINKKYFPIAVVCNLIRIKHFDPILCMTSLYLRKDILPRSFSNFVFFYSVESIQAILGDEQRTF